MSSSKDNYQHPCLNSKAFGESLTEDLARGVCATLLKPPLFRSLIMWQWGG